MSSAIRRSLRRSWIELAIFSVVINVFLLVPPLYMMQVYDRVLPSSSLPTLVYLSLIALASLAFLALMEIVRSIYCQRVALRLDRELGRSAFNASLLSSRGPAGDIQALRDLSTVRNFVASKGLANLIDLPFALLFVGLLFFIHPILAVVTVSGAGLLVLLVVANHYAARSTAGKSQESQVYANLLAQAFARNADTIRGMGMQSNVAEVWGDRFAESARLQDRAAFVNALYAGSSRTLRMVLQLSILGAGAVLVMTGEMTAGMIFASSTISGRALQPIDQLVAGWRQVADARKSFRRLSQAVASIENLQQKRIFLPAPNGKLTARDLVWGPVQQGGGSIPIMKRVSLELEPGESLAILGPSGAGKSTLARLLAGVIEPTGGSIALDGAEFSTWDPIQLGSAIGYLAQDVQLLPGTIAQNIARFAQDASDQSITDAAAAAEAHKLISGLANGYQTVIEGAASTLSGGTRQRIGLARAFYASPKVLVLDEPNANLDSEGEAALEKALFNAKKAGTTVVLVTHRTSIVLKCDKALVLNEGAAEMVGRAGDVVQRLSATVKGRRAAMIPAAQQAGPLRSDSNPASVAAAE